MYGKSIVGATAGLALAGSLCLPSPADAVESSSNRVSARAQIPWSAYYDVPEHHTLPPGYIGRVHKRHAHAGTSKHYRPKAFGAGQIPEKYLPPKPGHGPTPTPTSTPTPTKTPTGPITIPLGTKGKK
jgi:hypothetical protein